MDDVEDTREYFVVMNDEEQYSVWAVTRPIPDGWRDAGFRGSRAACLEHIDRVWSDIRPLSTRRRIAQLRDAPQQPKP